MNYLRERKGGEEIEGKIGPKIMSSDAGRIGDEMAVAGGMSEKICGTEFKEDMKDEEDIIESSEEGDEDAEEKIDLHAALVADDGEVEVERVEEESEEGSAEEDAVPTVDESGFWMLDLVPPGDVFSEVEGGLRERERERERVTEGEGERGRRRRRSEVV